MNNYKLLCIVKYVIFSIKQTNKILYQGIE